MAAQRQVSAAWGTTPPPAAFGTVYGRA